MSNPDSSKESLILQRKRYEALGGAFNKSSSMKSLFKVLFATTLIFGIPTVILLSNPLKDNLTIAYQMVIFGFRILLIAMCILLFTRITTELYTAKNDSDKKLEEIGYKDAKTNTKEEKSHLSRNVVYTFLKILIVISTAFGMFLLSSRDNYGYIIGQQALYICVLFLILFSIKYWLSRKPDYSPRLGGRLIVLAFVPALGFWGLEVIIGFFGVISDSLFHHNILQITYGLIYPFAFLFLLIAVLYTSKKTIREKQSIQLAKNADFDRRAGFIGDKNPFSRMIYRMQLSFNKIGRTITRTEQKEKDIDKKPNLLIIKSMWLTIFITFFGFAFIIPWNMFPQDGILLAGAAMIAYQYSMIKFERDEITVIAVPDKDETIDPPEIRTKELLTSTARYIMLPTMIFIVIQFIMNGVLTNGVFTQANLQLVLSFTWIAALIVIPLSIHIIYKTTQNIKDNRTKENSSMFVRGLLVVLIFEGVLYAATVGALVGALYGYQYELIHFVSLILQATFILVLIVLPVVFQLIAIRVDKKGFKILSISTYVLLGLINVGIFTGFILHILQLYFG